EMDGASRAVVHVAEALVPGAIGRFGDALDARLQGEYTAGQRLVAEVAVGSDRGHEQRVQAGASEGTHARLLHRDGEGAVEAAIGGETVNQARVVAADPVAALDVDGRAVRAARVGIHVDEQAAVVRGAAVDVVVEGPDVLHAGVGIGEVQG